MKLYNLTIVLGIFMIASSCENKTSTSEEKPQGLAFSPSNDSLQLPSGFKAIVVANGLKTPLRHVTVRSNGDVYSKIMTDVADSSIVALRDTDGDGVADVTKYFSTFSGTAIGIDGDYLYSSSVGEIYRFKFEGDELVPNLAKDTIVRGMLDPNQHHAKGITFDSVGNLYISIGAPSNACMVQSRTKGSPGQDPCPQLELNAGIWQYPKDVKNQVHGTDGKRYATGMRNPMALDWNTATNGLFALTHGRDQFSQLFPEFFDDEYNANFPAEEFFQIYEGDDFGWPYCYYNQETSVKLLNPEYGGDGKIIGRCADKKNPIFGFPGHMAPNDMIFYTGDQFPAKYKNGAFIAFHGSWNRAPLEQKGFFVVFVPFANGQISGEYEVFADGFDGLDYVESPNDAKHRPTGLAQGPDGSLYITDSMKGKIWRIVYTGE